MRKELLPPLAILAVILAFTLWNSAAMTAHTARWQTQLQQAEAQAQQEQPVQLQTWFPAASEHNHRLRDQTP